MYLVFACLCNDLLEDFGLLWGHGVTIEQVLAAFGNLILHKHAAPGKIEGSNNHIIAHSGSTMCGCSGSPIIDPISGRFVAIRMYCGKFVYC